MPSVYKNLVIFPGVGAVDQTMDSAIWINQLVLLVFIHWIVIYPVDSANHRLSNWGLKWTYDEAFEQLFDPGRGAFEQKISKNSNARGGGGGGNVKASL